MTVTALLDTMPLWEFVGWQHYYRRNGFAVDRQVGVTARAGSAICGTWGGDVQPRDLVPSFGPVVRSTKPMLAYVSSIPGAKVTRHER